MLARLPSLASAHSGGSARSTAASGAISAPILPLSMIMPPPDTAEPARVCSNVAAVTPVSITHSTVRIQPWWMRSRNSRIRTSKPASGSEASCPAARCSASAAAT
ncbi:Uncharacterised protein [Mycobacterium tuberculosis]|nr:Uncharacterised protein [Mycobacterium tuberculosis]